MVAKSRSPKVQPKLALASEWVPRRDPQTGKIVAEGKLWNFIELIAQSRREGKNRRDGATVSTRVLKLADKIGQDLFAAAAGDGKLSDDEAIMRKKRGRRKAMQTLAHL